MVTTRLLHTIANLLRVHAPRHTTREEAMPETPEPKTQAELDAELRRAQTADQIAELEKATALKRQAAAEAEKARATAEAATSDVVADQQRVSELARATHAKSVAEAKRDTKAAERDTNDGDAKAERIRLRQEAKTRQTVATADVASVKAFLPDEAQLKPLEGTVTADDKSGILAEALLYDLLTREVGAFVRESGSALAHLQGNEC